jgi:hypothetical protein
MVIAIDFDGTCVTHEFPAVGKDIGAAPVLRKLTENGHKLVLFTMRGNRGELTAVTPEGIENVTGNFLDDAVEWFKKNDIPLYGIQENPTQKGWTSSPKAYADLYIDDAALGCPLILDTTYTSRPYVDWVRVCAELHGRGLI